MDLKPCPFCGGEAEFERTGTTRRSCIVACTDCGCRMEGPDHEWNSGSTWNRRVPSTAQKLLRACKVALEAIAHQGGGDPRPHGSEEEWDEIEAAIAEAEGRPLPPDDDEEETHELGQSDPGRT